MNTPATPVIPLMTILGGHPVGKMMKYLGITLAISIATFILALMGGAGVALVVFIVGPLVLLFVLFIQARMFGNALRGRKYYASARTMVEKGQLAPSFVGRNTCCEGMAVIDEVNRMIFLNGELHGFENVKGIANGTTVDSRPYVDVTLLSGANAAHRIYFDKEEDAVNFKERTLNLIQGRG